MGNFRPFDPLGALLLLLAVAARWPCVAQPFLPPHIDVQPQSQVVAIGADVTLRVGASGSPPLRYEWRKNGVPLANETNASLALPRVQPSDGGSYTVSVFNNFGAIKSEPAVVVVRTGLSQPPSDSFRERLRLTEAAGAVQGDSSDASLEAGEPVVPGGGKSIWYDWIAPSDGIVIFSTRGSSFDTLLSVYTGGDLSSLRLVTSGDDEDEYYTSSVRFNARARNSYHIVLDGFGLTGAGGPFTLTWNLEVTTEVAPVIVTNPVSQSVAPGGAAVFEVVTESTTDQYQWYLNDTPMASANSRTLRVLNATTADIGHYSVRVTSSSGRRSFSAPAAFQLSSEPGVLVHDKFENMFFAQANGNRPAAGFVSIGLGGTVITNDFYANPQPQQADPTPCDSPFQGTLWLGLTATNTGVIQVDTTGSLIMARLAVYRLTGGAADFNNPKALVCDLTNGPAGFPCIAKFNGTNGTNYTIVVEGYQATGELKLTTRMGQAPPINAVTQCLAVAAGGSWQLSMPATNWIPVPNCQWRRNGQSITDATNTTLVVNNFNASLAGSYSVVMSNFVRVATNTVAIVVQQDAFALNYALASNNGNVGFVVSGAAGHAFVLERAPTVSGVWTPWVTNPTPCATLIRTNPNVLLDSNRFFRAKSWP